MRRNVRALGHVAEVAQIALIDYLGEICLGNIVHLAALRRVDEIEKRRESVAQADAPPAAVADIEDALLLAVERILVVVIRVAPIDRMADRRFEIAFTRGHRDWTPRSIRDQPEQRATQPLNEEEAVAGKRVPRGLRGVRSTPASIRGVITSRRAINSPARDVDRRCRV